MKPETTAILYKVQDKLHEIRTILDNHMYRGGLSLDSDEAFSDLIYCRKVYDSICKTLDLL